MKNPLPMALVLFALFWPGQANADCRGLTIKTVATTHIFRGGTIGYTVYDGNEYLQTVNMTVEAEATHGGCSYFTGLSAGQSGNFSQRMLARDGNTLNYNVYTAANKSTLLKEPPHATPAQVIPGYFSYVEGKKQTATHSFYWTITPGQIVPFASQYYDDRGLSLNLYSGTVMSSPRLTATKTLSFRATVNSTMDMSLVNSGSPFNINDTAQNVDFGTLSSGEELAFDLVVRSNSNYAVQMRSQNRQALKDPATSSSIPYAVMLNGGLMDLSSGNAVEILTATGTTPSTGRSYPVRFSIGQLSGAELAGTYSDVIAVEIIAK